MVISKVTGMAKKVRIVFSLQQEDGYPPFSEEFVRAIKVDENICEIDSMPFFIYGVNLCDLVSVTEQGDFLYCDSFYKSSGHLTYRLFFEDKDRIASVCETLRNMGCNSEGSHMPSLVAVDVPPTVDKTLVYQYLSELKNGEVLDFEDSTVEWQSHGRYASCHPKF
jgi:hypothetical protein